jgi:hypothetical protein
MLEANVGATATIQEVTGTPYVAKILAVPKPEPRAGDGNPFGDAAATASAYPQAPVANLLLLETTAGIKAIGLEQVREVTLPRDAKRTRSTEGWRSDLTLQFAGASATSGRSTTVGVMYLQKGLRWIPAYKVTLDGKGTARVQLQATLINELTDLDDATVNLVIGVPTFAFQDTPDPVGLQDTFARLSRYFHADARTPAALSNAILSQGGFRAGEAYDRAEGGRGGGGDAGGGPVLSGGEGAEDLFVFTAKNVRLKRNARMVLPVAEFTLPYKNVYTAELLPSSAFTRGGYENHGAAGSEAFRLMTQPRVVHKARLTNNSAFPLTTAPALLLRENRVIAQGMMTYTSRGGTSDLTLTDASDVTVKRSDKESKRAADAMRADGSSYARVDMAGAIELRNFRAEPVEVEITRYVLGRVDTATADGAASALDPFGDDALPSWIGQYGAAQERLRFTGLGKVFWKRTLPPAGNPRTLEYAWHYFVR